MGIIPFLVLASLVVFVSGECRAQDLSCRQNSLRLQMEGVRIGEPMAEFDDPLPVSISSPMPSDGKYVYGTDALSEMHRLFHDRSGEDEPQEDLLLRKILIALPLMGRNNTTQLFFRPEQDIYLTMFKRFTMKQFIKATHVTKPAGAIAIDTHVHTCYSHDSLADPATMLLSAAKHGLSGIAITDHDNLQGAHEAQKIAARLIRSHELPDSFFVIPGEEVGSSGGHIIGLFLTKEIPPGMTPAETTRAIHEQGGFAIAAHPLLSDGLGGLAKTLPFDAVESMNGAEELHFAFARKSVREQRLAFYAGVKTPTMGSSDAHDPQSLGTCYTLVNCPPDLQAVHDALVNGKVVAATGMPKEDLDLLARRGLPRILTMLDSMKVPGQWLQRLTHSDSAGFSIFPRPGIRLGWYRKL